MVESLPFVLILGTLLGFLAGIGVGGGSLLMLWLTLAMGLDQAAARGINLLFFLPSAAIACCFRKRQGTLKLKKLLPAILAGMVSAAVCSLAAQELDTAVLKRGFGILLLATGLRELLYKPRDP